MENKIENIIEKREYKGKKNSDIINFPVELRHTLLLPSKNKEVLNMPIHSLRILFKILNDVSNDQFQNNNLKQKKQLSLFEEDFKTENNTYARFSFKTKDIDVNLDYKAIKKGLEFLENFNKGWYKSVNTKGKIISSYGGVISQSNISEGKITFLVSSYWIERILFIPKYNVAYFQTAWGLSNTKHVLFYLWLLEIPENGTRVNFEKFQESYNYNYPTVKDFAKYFLKIVKKNLDKKSNLSFNYSTKNNIISIVPYFTKDVDLVLDKLTIEKQEITQKLHYWKTRHKLTKNHIDILKSLINLDISTFKLFLNSYDNFIKGCKINRQKATFYQGDFFFKIFQEEIIAFYKTTTFSKMKGLENAYPIIISNED